MSDETHAKAFDFRIARAAVGAYNDTQQTRISMMNRVRDIVRKKNEGIPFDAVEEEKDPDKKEFEPKYADERLPDLIEEMQEEGKLSPYEYDYLLMMLDVASVAEDIEDQAQNVMKIAKREPVYTEWLQYVYGVSHTLTAKLLYHFGYCEDFAKVSNLWSYAGLAPGQKRKRGEKTGFSPEAKTLSWLVADRIILQADNSRYYDEFYVPYKEKQVDRMENSECPYCEKPSHEHYSPQDSQDHYCTEEMEQLVELHEFDLPDTAPDNAEPPWSQGHADARAKRYLAKKFLKHYWAIARDIAGLETPDDWVIAHGGHEKRTDTFENPFYAKRELQSPDD